MNHPTARSKIFAVVALLFFMSLGGAILWRHLRCEATVSVAFVGFFDSDARYFEEAGDALGLRVDALSRAEFFETKRPSRRYDVAIVRAIGMTLDDFTQESLERLDGCGAAILYPSSRDDLARFSRYPVGLAPERLEPYLATVTRQNAKSALTLLRNAVLGEPLDAPDPEEPPASGYFFPGSDVVSATFKEWLGRPELATLSPTPEDAPRVALVGPFLNPYKIADSKPIEAIVDALARRGLRAVPIHGFRDAPELLDAVQPDLIVAFPLGRLLPDDAATTLFTRCDAPVFTAISLSVSRKVWESEPVGMTPTYQNLAVALPELDGATAPTPISVLAEDAEGREVRAPLQDRIEQMAERAARTIKLRRTPNAQKRIAIFYRRGPGAAAITAQSLDAVPSLYHALVALRAEGYDLGSDFPETEEEFAKIVDVRGRTIGQWAPGAFRKFLDEGAPERVATSDYLEWSKLHMPASARQETEKVWGPAPGLCFTGQTENGASFIAVSRILFGNVALMPQPTTELLADDPRASDFNSVHGSNKAPPHYYQAAYLWAREGFQADAIVHFGTHGSLEFTRGKSLMLTENDWSDAIVGPTPNVYLYSVNNVGEALLAKRRIYATLVSHTTPPFVKATPTDENVALERALDAFDATIDDDLRRSLAEEVEKLARDAGLTLFDPAQFERNLIHDEASLDEKRAEFYRDQLRRLVETNVTDGLHRLGRPWTEERLQSTADAIGTPEALANLRESTAGLETRRFLDALAGRYIPASTGGDPLVNPESLPTGRNISGTNVEQTPDAATFRVAQRLTDELIAEFKRKNGRYPRKIALTLWGGEYLRTRGLTVAQALWAMGARPVYDKRGALRDLELAPSEELGRPRIDVLVQTSGQFRDAAPSRIELLDRAARMAAAQVNEPYPNYTREHTESTARKLMTRGFVAEEAAELSTARIFGAPRALNYGTGIRSLVERSDKWETRGEIADQYLLNMGGVYRGAKVWGAPIEGLLEANLEGVDVVLQSRSSNTWGPVKLDHLYEFGTLGSVVREKTGTEPTFLLSDARRPKSVRTQSLDEAVRDELQTTLWNREWLKGLMREKGGGAGATLAKSTQNLFGWSAVGAEGLVDDAMWRRTVETFVDDKLEIGLRQYLEETNPAALAETSAVALDAARKNFWRPSPEELEKLAATHAETIKKYGVPCSYNVCGNVELRDFIVANLPETVAKEYRDAIDGVALDSANATQVSGVELVETKTDAQNARPSNADAVAEREAPQATDASKLAIAFAALVIFTLGFALGDRSRRTVRQRDGG